VNGARLSLTKTYGDDGLSLSSRRKATLKGMGAGRAILDPANVEHRSVKVHLIPTEVANLGSPQSVPGGDHNHRSVPMAPPVLLGRLNQSVDLAGRQMLAGCEAERSVDVREGFSSTVRKISVGVLNSTVDFSKEIIPSNPITVRS